jgi:hypothetical protein
VCEEADVTALLATAPTAIEAADSTLDLSSPPVTPARSSALPHGQHSNLKRQGGLTFSGGQKTMHITPALTESIEPRSEAEVTLMAECMTQATRTEGLARASMAMYERAADIYLERLVVYFNHPTRSPPDGLRYNKTTGEKLKAAAEHCTTVARQAAREREHRGATGDGLSPATAAKVARLIDAAADELPPTVTPHSSMNEVIVGDSGIAMWDGAACSMSMAATACAPMARERKRQKQPDQDREWARRVKCAAITVTVAQLQDATYKIANLRLRRIAGMVGVKQKLAPPEYTSWDCRRLVAEAMIHGNDRIAPCYELVVPGDM